MTEPAAVVYDLDGTLVRLPVDWDAARRTVVEVYDDAGVKADGKSLWDLLERSDEYGLREPVEAAIARHERDAAHDAVRLPTADELVAKTRPAAVVSLNCEAACRIALERHDLAAHVEAIIGRDTVSEYKPHPEPLLSAARALQTDPDRVLFVGDSKRDEHTARRAGTRFAYVDDGPSGH